MDTSFKSIISTPNEIQILLRLNGLLKQISASLLLKLNLLFLTKKKNSFVSSTSWIQDCSLLWIHGLNFDDKLCWRPYLNKFKTECLSRTKMIKIITNNSWGAAKINLTKVYKALILSLIDYGAIIYNSAK